MPQGPREADETGSGDRLPPRLQVRKATPAELLADADEEQVGDPVNNQRQPGELGRAAELGPVEVPERTPVIRARGGRSRRAGMTRNGRASAGSVRKVTDGGSARKRRSSVCCALRQLLWRPVGLLAALVAVSVLLPSPTIAWAGCFVDATVLIGVPLAVASAHLSRVPDATGSIA